MCLICKQIICTEERLRREQKKQANYNFILLEQKFVDDILESLVEVRRISEVHE